MPRKTSIFTCYLGPWGSQKQPSTRENPGLFVLWKHEQTTPLCVPLQCLGSIGIPLEKALKGYQAVRGKGGERKEQEGAGEPQFSYNHQIKSQGGGGFSRSSDLKVEEWKEEEAHLHRSSVRASSGRGSALLALCCMQGHAHTYARPNKHGDEVQSRPTIENIICGNL